MGINGEHNAGESDSAPALRHDFIGDYWRKVANTLRKYWQKVVKW